MSGCIIIVVVLIAALDTSSLIQMGHGGHFHLQAAELFISVSVSICPQPSLTHTLGNKNSQSTLIECRLCMCTSIRLGLTLHFTFSGAFVLKSDDV